MFLVGAATTGPVSTPMVMTMPGPVGGFLRDGQKTSLGAVAGLVAIDVYAGDPFRRWKDHGWQALGESVFNVGTIFVAPAKIGSLGRVGRVGEVALNVTDPLYRAAGRRGG